MNADQRGLDGHPIDHRLWRPPDRPWMGHMTWRDLLFAHWPVRSEQLRAAVPPQMEIEEFDGTAWLAVVPFAMTNIRLRILPPIPGLSRTLELNVRTYVRVGTAQGVYFFSLDAESWPAVISARATFHLNYFHARMSLARDGEWVAYESRRTHPRAAAAEFRGRYCGVGTPYLSKPGSLEHWLTERYALFTTDRSGRVIRGDIHHAQWPLQRAEAEFDLNAMTEQIGLELPRAQPLLHFAKTLEVLAWSPERVRPE
jgi:uncharacterized protein YqjF (DUF2071 family)